MQNIITIDGPAASGKSSVSRGLARKLAWKWLSTGAFYRAIGLMAHKSGTDQNSEKDLVAMFFKHQLAVEPDPIQTKVFVDGELCSYESICSVENGTRASNISRFEKVRAAVLQMQRACYSDPGLIAEGRDCGTVIFPKAALKVYLVANAKARALRRTNESQEDLKSVEEALKFRDEQDQNREVVPMEAADDAWVLDTSNLSLEEVVQKIYAKAELLFLNS